VRRGIPVWLVVVLLLAVGGGSATAAKKLLTGRDIKNSSLTGADIKNSSLTGSDVKDGSIGPKDLAKSIKLGGGTTVISGGPGEQGTPGSPGAPGTNGTNAFGALVYKVAGPFDSNAGELDGGAAECDSGQVAIGGGTYGDADSGQQVSASGPTDAQGNVSPSRWQVWMYNSAPDDSTFSVYAICAKPDSVKTP
jgi:hypothetical protein